MLQYIAPVLQFLIGVLVLDEQMPPARWFGFALVWVALVILSVDGVRHSRAQSLVRAARRAVRRAVVNARASAAAVASTTSTVTLSEPPAASAASTSRSAAACGSGSALSSASMRASGHLVGQPVRAHEHPVPRAHREPEHVGLDRLRAAAERAGHDVATRVAGGLLRRAPTPLATSSATSEWSWVTCSRTPPAIR